MYARGGERRVRHFYHVDESAGEVYPSTSPGEYSTHSRCVALAVAALQEKFGSQSSRCGVENHPQNLFSKAPSQQPPECGRSEHPELFAADLE